MRIPAVRGFTEAFEDWFKLMAKAAWRSLQDAKALLADDDPTVFRLENVGQRQAFIAAMSAEVVRRLEGRTAA